MKTASPHFLHAFILIGASGSGKSTVRKKLAEKYATAAFSLDDCRIKFFLENSEEQGLTQGDLYKKAFDYCSAKPKEFDAYAAKEWLNILQLGKHIIVDNVNGTRKSRAKWVDGLRKKKYHITMVQVQTPLNVILERQSTRTDKSVPAEAVKSQYMRIEEAMVGSECDSVIIVNGTREFRP